jgi:hypothetical protein
MNGPNNYQVNFRMMMMVLLNGCAKYLFFLRATVWQEVHLWKNDKLKRL